MRFDYELDSAGLERFINLLDIVNLIVDDRRRMIEIGPVRNSQHNANPATVEKRHVRRRLKKKLHSQRVAIKRDRAIEVFDVNKDLADLIQRRANRDWSGHNSSPSLKFLMNASVIRTA